ncbi:hypothetical protein INQ51_11145 [Maribellus sp. CM-23]|uniref:hypothetical protein n=1 Tax=Maribellus sp. CM-23 TaxID=2781026 RepID=UPI001F282E35|nr:hypothetical protein [Maribellus sp. CM-23]MCE4564864.1 hypothetical protein [Maribellus sp. CM-23]
MSEIKKENPFGTPDQYFDDFSARLHTRMAAEAQSSAPQKSRIFQLLKPALGLAASFAVVVMLVYVPLRLFMPKEINQVAQTSDTSDAGFLNIIEKIDEESFVALLNDTESEDEFTNDELALYVSANFSDYELYENLTNK